AAGGARTIAVNDQLWSTFLLQLEEYLPDSRFVGAGPVLVQLRIVKDAAEIAILREASRRTDDAWEHFCSSARLTGKSEREVAEWLSALMLEHGMESIAFCIVASGPNASSPHHGTSERVIEAGDPVVIDFGGGYQGYYSDVTRTPIAGREPDPELARIYEVVKQAQQAAFEAVKPGVACQEIDRAARRVITEAGYGDYFIHRVGHGLGQTVHEDPYLVEGNTRPLETGNVFSDEPGIYVPGKWGVRIEDTLVVTESGAERLNRTSKELLVLP
ncbi:MAG TPA: M24 family metallopeptidase, partial [Thermomicrobiaceae bacterium]|nr:M24 family metallopeptidase [Thermomicrobiaceae bacterium]